MAAASVQIMTSSFDSFLSSLPALDANSIPIIENKARNDEPPMDALAVKNLISAPSSANTVDQLQTALHQFQMYNAPTPTLEKEVLQLQILIQSRILQEFDRAGSGSPSHDRVNALCSMGKLWLSLGERDKAIGQLKKAVDLQQAISADDVSKLTMSPHEMLGIAYTENANYELAIQHHLIAIENYNKSMNCEKGDGDRIVRAALAYGSLASTYEAKSDYLSAESASTEAHNLLQPLPADLIQNNVLVGSLYSQIGSLHEKTGKYEQAVLYYEKAIPIFIRAKGPDHSLTQEAEYLLDMVKGFLE
jgi:tetratricopeptide (TPR) repeat protein